MWNKLKAKIRFTSILKPMIYGWMFSLAFCLGYYFIVDLEMNIWLQMIVVSLWLAIYGLGLYFCAGLVWGRRAGTLKGAKTGRVILWNFIWNFVLSLLCYFGDSYFKYTNMVLFVIFEIIALVFLIGFIPVTCWYYKNLYNGKLSIKDLIASVKTVWEKKGLSALNPWLVLLLVMVAWDSLFAGPMGLTNGFDALTLLSSLLFMGSPCSYWVLLLYLHAAGSGVAELVVLYICSSVLVNWYEINLIDWLGSDLPQTETDEWTLKR